MKYKNLENKKLNSIVFDHKFLICSFMTKINNSVPEKIQK